MWYRWYDVAIMTLPIDSPHCQSKHIPSDLFWKQRTDFARPLLTSHLWPSANAQRQGNSMHMFTGKGNPNNIYIYIYRIKQRKLEKATKYKSWKLFHRRFQTKDLVKPLKGCTLSCLFKGPKEKHAGIPSHLGGFCVEPYLLATSSTWHGNWYDDMIPTL